MNKAYLPIDTWGLRRSIEKAKRAIMYPLGRYKEENQTTNEDMIEMIVNVMEKLEDRIDRIEEQSNRPKWDETKKEGTEA
jgi:3-phenylpropionate/cinnamic acid dioxygenase small subunit